MIWLWRFLFGYVVISLSGEDSALMLNIASKNHIKIWNLRCKKGNITGNIGLENFAKLYNLRHGHKCRIKILQKHGLVFHTRKYSKRIGFFAGGILFLVTLFTLSSFVWVINIEGNVNIPKEQIIESCKKIGITEGIFKSKVNSKNDAQRLLLTQDGLAWCSLNIEGCILTVNLSEAEVSDQEERQSPSNIKSAFDGKITKIDAKSGTVLVKVGDTVSKGDLLVSGIIENLSSTVFVYSDAVITAQTQRTYSAQGNFVQKKNVVTEIKNRNTIEFFKIRIPLFFGSIKDDCKYSKKIKSVKLFDRIIPIKIATEKYEIIEKKSVTYEKDILENMLLADIEKQVTNTNLISAEETNREVIYNTDGILIKITYNCEENIAIQDKILLDTEN